ncbi:MAG: mechanosensitive ion channel family protein [Rhodothermales bacterium]|nr:mechanosensitive ion channel family protein [Rhodothermales bacterium]
MEINVPSLIDYVTALVTTFGLRLIGVFLLMIGAWIVAGYARRGVERSLNKTRLDLTLTRFFANITGWLVLLLAVLTALSLFGIQTTSFAAVIGAAGLAIGLGFQGTLSNFAAGVMLLTFRPFKIGDTVKVDGETGIIAEIDLFLTKMDTFDNRRIVLPNSKVFGNTIETLTYHPRRRADVPVGVSYEADLDATRAVLERAAASVPGRLDDPAPQVVLDGFGDSAVNWIVRVWAPTPDFLAIKQATIRAAKQHLDAEGLAIPYPQVDVHFDEGGASNHPPAAA